MQEKQVEGEDEGVPENVGEGRHLSNGRASADKVEKRSRLQALAQAMSVSDDAADDNGIHIHDDNEDGNGNGEDEEDSMDKDDDGQE